MKSSIEFNININDIDDLRVIINHREYRLEPVGDSQQGELPDKTPSFNTYVAQLIRQLQQEGHVRTAETYRFAAHKFLQFLQQDDYTFSQIDAPLIESYEQSLKNQGLVMNSISFYMRVLRSIYNKAVANRHAIDRQPFAHVYTGVDKTVKRAIPLDDIQRIRQLDGLSPKEELARNLFLFSFYTRGMSFIDMAYLTPANISNGILKYQRRKTNQELTISWEPQMQDIIARHPSTNPNYLLPIIKRSNGHERCQYREAQRTVNAMLKHIARKANINIPLSMYVARHSWASIARSLNIPVNVISAGMGHSSEKTTQIYLKSLDNKELNQANATIIQAVDGK